MIKRYIIDELLDKLKNSNKIIIIYGARQVGKTTLAKEILKRSEFKTLAINGDEKKYDDILSSQDLDKLKSLVSGYELLFIDEAQRLENIGVNLKILHDNMPGLKIMVTGSSSFDLANKIKEPLTGRTWTYTLYPLSFLELAPDLNAYELTNKLEQFLIYGSYPEVYTLPNAADKRKLLAEITSSYLYKDILELESIRKSDKISKLLKLLAFQIGQEISVRELADSLEMSAITVIRYMDLLEKAYVIFRLSACSKNLRKEISKKDKVYFYDLGIRNAIIDNFNELSERTDSGSLFENLLISERLKRNDYRGVPAQRYFWRVYTGAEIDYIEENAGVYSAYEFKLSKNKARRPDSFLKVYQNASFEVINKNNFLDFVL